MTRQGRFVDDPPFVDEPFLAKSNPVHLDKGCGMILTDIFRHPVKSLGSESLQRVRLLPDAALPGDRHYAITHGKSEFAKGPLGWVRCKNFLRIANVPQLAAYKITFEPERQHLWVTDATDCTKFDLADSKGRQDLVSLVMNAPSAHVLQPFSIVDIPGVSLSDSPHQAVSLGFRSTLRALEVASGLALDPRRFRMNLWIDGGKPWTEVSLVGREFRVGDIWFEGIERITRCLVPAASPVSGIRDTNPLKTLSSSFGRKDFGILARVLSAGDLAIGAAAVLD